VSRSTLKHERALIGGSHITRQTFNGLVLAAQFTETGGRPAIKDPVLRSRLVELEGRLLASEYNGYRLLTAQARGEEPGLAAMVMKLYATRLGYDIAKAAMDVLGDRGALTPSEANPMGMFVHAYMWSIGILIAGGTANIQRNIVAERGLGMPRDAATKRA
jgi:alkylation response protein AidB-like acyl-CoA dehydrogenase